MVIKIDPYVFGGIDPGYLWFETDGSPSYSVISSDLQTFSYSGGGSTSGAARTKTAIFGGRVYCEMQFSIKEQSTEMGMGITWGTQANTRLNVFYSSSSNNMYTADGGCGFSNTAGFYNEGSEHALGATWKFGPGDIIGFAVDTVALKMWFRKNGTWMQGDPVTGSSPSLTMTPGKLWYFYMGVYACFGSYGPRIGATIYPSPSTMTYAVPTGYVPYQPSDLNNPTPDSRLQLSVPFTASSPSDTSANQATLTYQGANATFSSNGLRVNNADCSLVYMSPNFTRAAGKGLVTEFYVQWAALGSTYGRCFYYYSDQGAHDIGFSGSSGLISWTFNGTTLTTATAVAINTRTKIAVMLMPDGSASLLVNDVVKITRTVAATAYTSNVSVNIGSPTADTYNYTVDDINVWIGTM